MLWGCPSKGAVASPEGSTFSDLVPSVTLVGGFHRRMDGGVCVSCSVVSTLCGPMDRSPPGSSVQGILQAKILNRMMGSGVLINR